jgi:hypothetical protein
MVRKSLTDLARSTWDPRSGTDAAALRSQARFGWVIPRRVGAVNGCSLVGLGLAGKPRQQRTQHLRCCLSDAYRRVHAGRSGMPSEKRCQSV